jgi:predicted permease
VIWIAAAILASTVVGLLAERRWPDRAGSGSRRSLVILLYFVLPPIVFVNLAETDFDAGLGVGLVLGVTSVAVVGAVAWLISTRLLDLDRPVAGAVICCSVTSNTGYLGYPLVLTLMGGDDLSQGVAYDVVVSGIALTVFAFGVGAAFGTRAGAGFSERLRSFFLKNPLLYAAVLGALFPASATPDFLVEVSWVLVALVLPVGFFEVGAVIAEAQRAERLPTLPGLNSRVATVAFSRLVVSPAALSLLAMPFTGIPRSFFLLAAMPAGLNSMIVAHAYGLDLRTTAEAVGWTTAIVVLVGLAWSVFG